MSSGITARVRELFSRGTVAGLSERQLLDRFLADRDPTAFEAIVRRHGPMVLGVCRRWLDDPNDADDAFQATFLILVRKARDLRDRDLLAAWLHGVATRVARRARQQADRRRRREAVAAERRAREEAAMSVRPPGLGPELHEELARLPRAYREVLVLCYLEGRSHEQAANELGWPIGTVKGRLARARDQLRDRLVRRGLQASAGSVASAIAPEAIAVSPALIQATVQAASAAAVGQVVASAAVSTSVAYLTHKVVQSMFLTKMTMLGATGVVLAGLATTGVVVAQGGQGRTGPGSTNVLPARALDAPAIDTASAGSPSIDLIEVLQQKRIELARQAVKYQQELFDKGVAPLSALFAHEEKLAEALLDAARTPPERIDGLAKIVEARAKRLEMLKKEVNAGRASGSDVVGAELSWIEARVQLAKAKAGNSSANALPPPPGGFTGAMGPGAGGPPGSGTTVPQPVPVPGGEGFPGHGGGGFGGGGGAALDGGPDDLEARLIAARAFFFKALDAEERTELIAAKLNEPFAANFDQAIPLREFVLFLRNMTADDKFPKGIPIYVDEVGMREAGRDNIGGPDSEVRIDLEGVALKTVLRLVLKQLNLVYIIKEGVLIISTPEADRFLEEFDEAIGEAKAEAKANPRRGGFR